MVVVLLLSLLPLVLLCRVPLLLRHHHLVRLEAVGHQLLAHIHVLLVVVVVVMVMMVVPVEVAHVVVTRHHLTMVSDATTVGATARHVLLGVGHVAAVAAAAAAALHVTGVFHNKTRLFERRVPAARLLTAGRRPLRPLSAATRCRWREDCAQRAQLAAGAGCAARCYRRSITRARCIHCEVHCYT
jgi:hypothetical protein